MGVPITHFEIGCRDLDRQRAFYASLFGWEFQDCMGIAMVSPPGGKGIGGHLGATGQLQRNYVTVYAEVDDIESYLARLAPLGGRVLLPKTEVPQAGWFAWFADPEGNALGLWQNAPPA